MSLFDKIKSSFTSKPSSVSDYLPINSKTILQFHWEKFIYAVSEYSKIDFDLLEKYGEEFHWRAVSKNENLDWTDELIEKFKEKINWAYFTVNKNINWDFEKIEKFKKYLEIDRIGSNPSLILDEKLLDKYSKKLIITFQNPLLTEELVKKYNLRINTYKPSKSYSEKTANENSVKEKFDSYMEVEKEVYLKFFEPIIKEQSLNKILSKKFNSKQNYYYLTPIQNDKSGLTPEFEINNCEKIKGTFEEKGLVEIEKPILLKNGSLQEGKNRLYEIVRGSSFSFSTLMIVSENVKIILEQFKLPSHKFHTTNFKPKHITTETKYFVFQLDFDQLNKDLDFNQEFYLIEEINGLKEVSKIQQNFSSSQEIYNFIDKKREENKDKYKTYYVKITPEKHTINSDYDIFSFSFHKHIIVNEYLKDTLEKHLPNQMVFKSAQNLGIEIPQIKYEEKASREFQFNLNPVKYELSEEMKFYISKQKRIKKEKKKINENILPNDEFFDIQKKLNVIIPNRFKNNYRNKKSLGKNYSYLEIKDFFIENEYSDSFPETFRTLFFAEQNNGDFLGLILEKDDDFKLQEQIYEFYHETGDFFSYTLSN